jgi:hypothetical protein
VEFGTVVAQVDGTAAAVAAQADGTAAAAVAAQVDGTAVAAAAAQVDGTDDAEQVAGTADGMPADTVEAELGQNVATALKSWGEGDYYGKPSRNKTSLILSVIPSSTWRRT